MNKKYFQIIIPILVLVSIGTVMATEQINIRYGSDNTIETQGIDFSANKTLIIKYYSDGALVSTKTISTDIHGRFTDIIPLGDLPEVAVGYTVCESSTGTCSETLFSLHLIDIPNQIENGISDIEDLTNQLDQIIMEFRNETNITSLRDDWGLFKANVELSLGKLNDTVRSYNSSIEELKTKITTVEGTVPVGVDQQITAMNNKIDTVLINSQTDNENLKRELQVEIGSTKVVSFVTLAIMIIAMVVMFIVSKKGKFGRKDNGQKEQTGSGMVPMPIVIAGKGDPKEIEEAVKKALQNSQNTKEQKKNNQMDPKFKEDLAKITY